MALSVMRLRNSKGGRPYDIERVDDLTEAQAIQVASSWWESGGTVAMLVLRDGQEDTRYQREYCVEQRIPEAWPQAPKPRFPSPSPAPQPRAAPTIDDPVEVAAPRQRTPTVRCPVCGRTVPEGTLDQPVGEKGPSSCPRCGLTFICRACAIELPPSRRYPDDRDPTPSGRLAAGRCLECGSPQPGLKSSDLWRMYTRR